MASRKITDLDPRMQTLCQQFLDRCKAAGIDVLITCTYRSNDEQAQLYAQGRTAPGKIVTNAKPGQSKHNCTLNGQPAAQAFDVVPLLNGKPEWNAKHPAWATMGSIGEALGLEWAGHWRTFKEMPHFQLKTG